MSKSCHHNLPSSCVNTSEIIDDVKNKIESCIQEYMNLEETVTYLQKNHKINRDVTKLIWDQLQRDSPEFFKDYHLKLEMTRQIKMFNGLLAKQVALMIEFGELDISSNPSSAILKFLSQDPEGVRVLDKLANSPAYPEVNPSSLALAGDTNGPTVNQLQIPNDQQNQVQPYHWSTSNVFSDNYPAASTVAPTTTAPWFPSNNLPNIGAPTVAQAATMPQDPFTFGFGGNIGCNGPSFMAQDLAQLVMPSENQLNGQYLPPLQLQNFSQADQSTLQYGVSNNGIQYGGNNIGVMQSENLLQDLYGQHLPHFQLQNFPQQEQSTLQYDNNGIQHGGNNIGVIQFENQLQYQPQLELQQAFLPEELQPLQYGGNNNWLQNGGSNNGLEGVIHESEVFNNLNSGNETLAMPQIQHEQQGRGGL